MVESFICYFFNIVIEGLEVVAVTKSISVFVSDFHDKMICIIGNIDTQTVYGCFRSECVIVSSLTFLKGQSCSTIILPKQQENGEEKNPTKL